MLTSPNPDRRMLSSVLPIWLAIVGNVLVASSTYAIVGWNAAGGHAAARNTARFSFLWFVFGFAAPGLQHVLAGIPAEARIIQAFVSAHMVHYCAVLMMGHLAPDSILLKPNIGSVLFVAIGFLLVLTLGLTANPGLSRNYRRLHAILLYLVFLIFLLDYGKHPERSLRFMVIPVVLALLLRWSSRLTMWTAQPDA